MSDDRDIQIPLKPLLEEFVCPICFDMIKNAYMTPCGHNFCRQCIDECLNVKRECPVCHHAPLAPESLVKNRSLDNILVIANDEKEKVLNSNFQALVRNSCTGDLKLSPLQEVFQTRMRVCINAYENYYSSLVAQRDSKLQKAKHKLEEGSLDKKEYDAKVEKVGKKFETSVRLLLEGYDKMLKEVLPTPSFVPMAVKLVLVERDVVFPKVVISPIDHLQDIIKHFEKQMKGQGMVVVSWDKDVEVFFKNPFSLPPSEEGEEEGEKKKHSSSHLQSSSSSSLIIVEEKKEDDKKSVDKKEDAKDKGETDDDNDDDDKKGDEVVIDDPLKPMHLYGVMPGATIYLKGHFVLKSDLSDTKCFVERFSKDSDEPEHLDYFMCKTCGINWICNVCARECHAGHDVSVHIKDHAPTWACCYCWKKCKTCKFSKKKKKRK